MGLCPIPLRCAKSGSSCSFKCLNPTLQHSNLLSQKLVLFGRRNLRSQEGLTVWCDPVNSVVRGKRADLLRSPSFDGLRANTKHTHHCTIIVERIKKRTNIRRINPQRDKDSLSHNVPFFALDMSSRIGKASR